MTDQVMPGHTSFQTQNRTPPQSRARGRHVSILARSASA
jgi:hypothetical protein